jgi:hypothetical protein
MITVMRSLDPLVLNIVPIVSPLVVRERRSGSTHQDHNTQGHGSSNSHRKSPLSGQCVAVFERQLKAAVSRR